MNHRFILQPYRSIASRHTCPECNHKKCFSRYIDTQQEITFPSYVGRCNREQKCGYHFSPKNYFEKYPDKKYSDVRVKPPTNIELSQNHTVDYIDSALVRQTLQRYGENNLYQFLSSQFGKQKTLELMIRYKVGTANHWPGSSIFWQTDTQDRIRTGKIMLYDSETGKRVKKPHAYITWVHSVLHKNHFNLKQCFFGEHLLTRDRIRPVALVESEKTALIATFYLPQYLWIASGGKNGCLNPGSLSVLKNRTVILFPDLGATEYWQSKIPLMESLGIDIRLFDYLEQNATDIERKEGYDIADFLLRKKTGEAIMHEMINKNCHLKTLIEFFDLKRIDVSPE